MGYKSIGRRLQLAREEAGLSQEQLAVKLGCSHSTLSNYEKGRRRLYLAQLEKIAEMLQKPIEYFMQPMEEPATTPKTEAYYRDDPEIQAAMESLARLSPAGRKFAADFIEWLRQREEVNDA